MDIYRQKKHILNIWIINLNVNVKTITLSEENMGENLQDLELGEEFLTHDIKNTIQRKTTDKLDFMKSNDLLFRRLLRG